MRKVLRWVGFGLAGLVGLGLLGVLSAYAVTRRGVNRTWDITPAMVTIPATSDAAAIKEGQRLYSARGCAECHAADGGGKLALDDPGLGQIYAPNLTRGKGSAVSSYTDLDWVRCIRHGVKPDHHSVLLMPANEYNRIGDRELGMLIAYLKTVPAVDREPQPSHLGLIVNIVYALGLFPLVPAELVPHTAARPVEPPVGVTVEYGRHLASIQCVGCHGEGLSGGPLPGAPPSLPVPKNLTPDAQTGLGKWSQDDFLRAMRTGKRPDGSDLNPFMPWRTYSNLNDTEMSALWAYLQSLPAHKFGSR